ncbi:phosphotransferase [Cellulomonas sp. McL0617]|uniref:phosphotransferase n=1 Tax=Cellulomonas sp. McL0617 TaxID=3415675 RepID=UPI003CF75B7C
MATGPVPSLASGEFSDLYALDDRTVLRRDRSGRDTTEEADLLRHAVAHGFPAPAVLAASGPDLVMERLHGPTLLQALGADEVTLPEAAAIMADLHTRLHAIAAPADWAASDAWPRIPAGPVLVHLDIHPANIILSEEHGPALVDWANARTGTAELDVALTALIVAEVAVDAGGLYSQAARALLASFLHAIGVDPVGALDHAAALRVEDPSLVPGERALVPAAAALVRDLVAVATPATST